MKIAKGFGGSLASLLLLAMMAVGCAGGRGVASECAPKFDSYVSTIRLRVDKPDDGGGIDEVQVSIRWEESEQWGAKKETPEAAVNGREGEPESMAEASDAGTRSVVSLPYFRVLKESPRTVTAGASRSVVSLPYFRVLTHEKEKPFRLTVARPLEDPSSESISYLKGRDVHKEENYSGLSVTGNIVSATETEIHLSGTLVCLGGRERSRVWPFDVIVPYGKDVKIWEHRVSSPCPR